MFQDFMYFFLFPFDEVIFDEYFVHFVVMIIVCGLLGFIIYNRIPQYVLGRLTRDTRPVVLKSPGKPTNLTSGPQSVKLSWKQPKETAESEEILSYRVRIQNLSGTTEKFVPVENGVNRMKVELPDLKPGYKYRFVVSAVCGEHGESKQSVSNTVVPDYVCDPPSKPRISQLSTDSIKLEWKHPLHKGSGVTIEGYRVRYFSNESKRWQDGKMVGNVLVTEINDLSFGATYKFAIKAVCNKGESNESEASDEIFVKARPKDRFRINSEILSHNIPSVHLLNPVEETNRTNDKHNLRMCDIGEPNRNGRNNKVVIIVGATGAGKTTLINGMVNYMLGIEWTDKFRFKLIADAHELENKSQSKSQTQWITSYTINQQDGYRVPYTLTLVDTPGFGDTSGIKRDREITHQIMNFLSKKDWMALENIDAIGFVAQSALPRLTPTQQFIFDSIIALFGKDLERNIFMLVTFADGNRPPVLSGLRQAGIPYNRFFKFNNSALFAPNDEDIRRSSANENDNFATMFWDMGLESFKSLFDVLDRTRRRSLKMTREVLQERFGLEKTVHEMQELIKAGFEKMEELREAREELEQYKRDENIYKNYQTTLVQEAAVTVPVAAGTYTTNCLTCNFTCHYPCPYNDDNSKHLCQVMNNGYCTVCPQRCHWNSHRNMHIRFELKKSEQIKDSAELKEKYEDALKNKDDAESLLQTLKEEMEDVKKKVKILAKDVKKRFARLEEIALKPNPIKSADYIDMLIDTEKKEAKEGWQPRVEQLQDLKHQAEIMFSAQEDNYDPFHGCEVKRDEE